MNKAVIYARYSSDSQTEQSIDGQLRVCKEYAERNGLVVVNEYIDRQEQMTSDQHFNKCYMTAKTKALILF